MCAVGARHNRLACEPQCGSSLCVRLGGVMCGSVVERDREKRCSMY